MTTPELTLFELAAPPATAPIRALSLTRPWTALVLEGHKPIENRTWTTPYRGPMVIHGAKSWDGDTAADLAEQVLHGSAVAFAELRCLKALFPTGYLGVVDLVDVCTEELAGFGCDCGPWAMEGQTHWRLANPRKFHAAIPGPGRLGLFPPSDEALEAASSCP